MSHYRLVLARLDQMIGRLKDVRPAGPRFLLATAEHYRRQQIRVASGYMAEGYRSPAARNFRFRGRLDGFDYANLTPYAGRYAREIPRPSVRAYSRVLADHVNGGAR
jgi:hypothetical protein